MLMLYCNALILPLGRYDLEGRSCPAARGQPSANGAMESRMRFDPDDDTKSAWTEQLTNSPTPLSTPFKFWKSVGKMLDTTL